jgi:hypothetical protein
MMKMVLVDIAAAPFENDVNMTISIRKRYTRTLKHISTV